MKKLIGQFVYGFLRLVRRSPLRRVALATFVILHNASYHMISFFASHSGLHPKHDILRYHQFFVDHVQATDDVLDVGSGNGAVAYDVARKAHKVVGVDIRAANVQHAQKNYRLPNLSFMQADATTHPFAEKFDVIILSNVLEHIENRIEFLRKLSNLAPTILIRVPLITRDWVTVYKKNEGFEYRLDATHFIEYTEAGFRDEVTQAGLSIKHLHTVFGELYAVITRA